MPTPVSAARQCLTAEATHALDEAVAVARRRGHAQTTSLHAVSAFLALPSSALREACARARSSAYPPRLQFKALELCFGVALDRLPSSQALDEPPISNSLMAAIRRSQANQRRNPESFHLFQQQQQQSSMSCVKVELQQLILSILDDPVVSRVFGEAGFRSCDIKLAVLRPPPPLVRYPRSRCPPLFLCNLTGVDSEPGRRNFSFPFSGLSGIPVYADGDENSKRIGEVLARKKGRNPLLVGVYANDAMRSFGDCIERRKGGVLPVEVSELSFICMEKEVSKFITENGNERLLGLRFEEVGRSAESSSGSGVIVSFGDLKGFVADDSVHDMSYVVSQLTSLLELHRQKLWLMGAAASYETYLKFLTKFPSIEKDWDLQLLPITSHRPSFGGLYSRPYSLMESFVPFGGVFCTSSDLKGPLSSICEAISCCHLCNEKYEQEVSSILKAGHTVSVADQYQSSLSFWLQSPELTTSKGLDVVKAKDDGTVLKAKIIGLRRKWNDICQRLHQSHAIPKADIYQDGNERPGNQNSDGTVASQNESGGENVFPFISLDRAPLPQLNVPVMLVSETKSDSFLSKLQVKHSNDASNQKEGVMSASFPLPHWSVPDGHKSPSSATSVTTDLGLGTLYASNHKEMKKPTLEPDDRQLQNCSSCLSAELNVVNGNVLNPPARSSPFTAPDLSGQLDPRDFKNLWRGLTEKVGRQDEAICAVGQTVARCRKESGRRRGQNLKGDIWFSFLGPDRVAKKRIALALAEVIFGSKENLICVDLSSQDGITHSSMVYGHQEMNGCDVKLRGKTVTDYITGELGKKPLSIVFLENVDKADLLVQNSLSQAIRTGKFSDSHGREVSINNAIFVTTSRIIKGNKNFFSGKESVNFPEERILGAQGLQMQMLLECVLEDTAGRNNPNVLINSRKRGLLVVNKRKLSGTGDPKEQNETLEMTKRVHKVSHSYLDLNLPIEAMEANDMDYGSCDSDSVSENSEAWLEGFLGQVDETVIFKPFDFDGLADKILKDISESFNKVIGPDSLLEIDSEVMEQILAAAWLSDKKRTIEDWVDQVLGKCFTEIRKRDGFSAGFVLKLAPCEGVLLEEQTFGICLPARIILN
ncbi:PREDICTED: protein SMAX1-LIKE 6-like isoform X2 [Nelumbo nucifera]|uniref:Protein SMAX1-LIKE 6-like isoform X2 n=1 Tax=Nelumbo nucifera TaxID=4432 RepID=A0A1U8Q7Y2_NELNU|nr:PREDICTED: protein SMAX1-LIKE 6-like isoform X2 [Nelumbo nucifera]